MNETSPTKRPKGYAHPAIFGLLVLPFGAAVGELQVAFPHWLARDRVDLAVIGWVSAMASQPLTWKLLWVPLIDLGSVRKRWYFWSCLLTAGAMLAIGFLPNPSQHINAVTVLLGVSMVGAATLSAALDALMAVTTLEADKGRAGGWYAAGNVGGTSALGGIAIWLAAHSSQRVASEVMAAVVIVTSLAVFVLTEHPTAAVVEHAKSWLSTAWENLKQIVGDLWATVKSREGLSGALICLAPIGCGALTNLFNGMSDAYKVSDNQLSVLNVVWSTAVSVGGSLVGGYLADRMNRRVAYALSGGVTALTAIAMALGPMTPSTFTWGMLGYNFAVGISYAAFYGMVLEMVSHGAAVTTKYTLFVAFSNQAINYVTYLDGRHFGLSRLGEVRGTIVFDAIFTFVGIGIFALIVMLSRAPKTEQVAPALG